MAQAGPPSVRALGLHASLLLWFSPCHPGEEGGDTATEDAACRVRERGVGDSHCV